MNSVDNFSSLEKQYMRAERKGIYIYNERFPEKRKGFFYADQYGNSFICINKRITSSFEERQVLAEEMGHELFTVGDILNQDNPSNRKQEIRAKNWSYYDLISLEKLIEAYEYTHINSYTDLAEWLEVTESFLKKALSYYDKKHGMWYNYRGYYFRFNPLNIAKPLEFCE